MIGLSKVDIVTIFKRHFKDQVFTDTLINTMAMAVGEVIEENNKKIADDFKRTNSTIMSHWIISESELTMNLMPEISQAESDINFYLFTRLYILNYSFFY